MFAIEKKENNNNTNNCDMHGLRQWTHFSDHAEQQWSFAL